MKPTIRRLPTFRPRHAALITAFLMLTAAQGQLLLNIDFAGGPAHSKTGFAATGIATNDHWNSYRHYEPRFVPGMPLVPNGVMQKLQLADGMETTISVAVTNAPGMWGNATGDPMFDSYLFSDNGSNLTVTLRGLAPGSYHFYLYGHADPDVSGEQNSVFTLTTGTNQFGPATGSGRAGWKAGQPWQERAQYVVFRDVPVGTEPLRLEVAPGPNGVAVLNGIQVLSRGTGAPKLVATAVPTGDANTNLLFRDIAYAGQLSDYAARFNVTFTVESMTTNEIAATLFEGEVALVSPKLPKGLRLISQGEETRLLCATPGAHEVKLELVARISRVEPWNQVRFTGPSAPIATVTAAASAPGVEIQMLSGTQVTEPLVEAEKLRGFLGADRILSLRWQSKGAEVARKSLVTVETTTTALVTPSVIKFTTALKYNILQAPVPRLLIQLPSNQALTRIQGDQIRDWQIKPGEQHQLLAVEFIKPVDKTCALTLYSEQAVEEAPLEAVLAPPRPLAVERESGALTISADDATVELRPSAELRQVNAASGAVASYRYHTGGVSTTATIRRIKPVLKVTDRVTARMEETRLVINHSLNLNVEQAGIYTLHLTPQTGMVVSEVKGDGVEDWKATKDGLVVSFGARVMGERKLQVQLEQANKTFPEFLDVRPLALRGATNLITRLGVAASAGIRLKTAELTGLREVAVTTLSERGDETLAFAGESPDWQARLQVEKLAPRIVAEVFNLVAIGDGLVGGSATIRYGIINQGVQEFRVTVPPHWRNLEFTGANIRRKEQQTNTWIITLQDKAWGGYTLVITYDYQFDPKGATLDLAGAHALAVERETGSLGLMTAASLKITPAVPTEPLRRVDESELSDSDRALCTRPLLLAYKYLGGGYQHSAQVTRFEEVPVLEAVADRTELTTVLTEEGQLLTQSSFMVKNNEKQFQRFKLPRDATFWSSFVNGQPAKPERDGDWFLVPLPRDANRDQAFAVEIVYAQKINFQGWLFPRRVELVAPLTDIPNTYAEWQLFAPPTQRLSGFAGNMTVASGTTYGLSDGWQQFLGFYGNLIEHHLQEIVALFVLASLLVLVIVALRRGFKGAVTVIAVFGILALLAAMLLPALSRAKSRAQRISAVNNLKQIGLAAKTWALDNGDVMPPSYEAMREELSTDKVTIDPKTGQKFIYVGTGKSDTHPEAIIAYSPSDVEGRAVLFADGSVQVMNQEKFDLAMQRDAALPRTSFSANPPLAMGLDSISEMSGLRGDDAAKRKSVGRTLAVATASGMSAVSESIAVQDLVNGAHAAAPALAATASGVRPIRIEIPRAGQAFSFTKVLNSGSEPLRINVAMMRLKTYRAVQMVFQVCTFLVGLGLLAYFYLIGGRRSFGLAVAASLVIWSVISLLVMWRWLHVVLILAVPALIGLLVVWAVYKLWHRRRSKRTAASAPPPPITTSETGATLSLLLLAGALSTPCLMAQGESPKVPAAVSIHSAVYKGTVGEKVARFEVTLQVSSVATNVVVPLFGDEVAVESFQTASEARLVRDQRGVGVLLPGKTDATLQFRIVVRLGGDISRKQLVFAIPAALASEIILSIAEPEAAVEFPSAVSFERTTGDDQTAVRAVIGAGGKFSMNWTPRVKRATEIAATVFAHNTTLVALGGGVHNTRVTIDYQVSQGELRQLRLSIPEGQRVLRVEGESLRTWEVRENVLQVDLLKGVSPTYRLAVETERLLGTPPTRVTLDIPHALDVKRETGVIAFRAGEELAVAVTQLRDLQRIDAEEFARNLPELKENITSAFRFLKPGFLLAVATEIVQPEIEAVVLQKVKVETEAEHLSAQVNYAIKKAGVFSLRIAVPDGFRIETVGGVNLSQWLERKTPAERVLEIELKERTMGAYRLNLGLTRSYKEPPSRLKIAAVHPLNTSKLSGFVAVVTEPGLAVKTGVLDNLTEIPFSSATLPRDEENTSYAQSSALAYKFMTSNPNSGAAWSLDVNVESVEPWVRAEVLHTITVSETLVTGKTQVKFEVANAPLREFRVSVPAAFKNVELTGAQIRRRDQTNEQWRVELQGKVRGDYILTITWEMPKSAASELVTLEGIRALGVERETGWMTLIARPPLQVSEQSPTELLSRIDVRELPAWAGRPDPATVLAYRYSRPGYQLQFRAKRFADAEVLQALIDSARLTTVIADDGQVMTEISLSVRNNGRQHLELNLPAGSTIWSTFVAGDPVRPNKRDGKFLLPLSREAASDAPIQIDLAYVGDQPFPKHSGEFELASPTFDVPMKNARWDLYLPPDYEYSRFAGSMARISDSSNPVIQVYSLSEYNQQQQALKDEQTQEAQSDLKAAKESLSGGNLRGALSSLSRIKSKEAQLESAKSHELKLVEQALRKAQSSNLIAAQNLYFYANAGESDSQPALASGKVQQPVGADSAVASLQWEKLEKAQQVSVAKVTPLRVNLPTRGVHHTFAQVLQTEIGKPMTVRLQAENTKDPSWPRRIGLALLGFGALWLTMAVVASRRKA